MSNGIWTKHFSVEGKIFYFNAAQNRSLWIAPQDSIIHEAVNARPPTYIELAGASSSYGKSNEIVSVAPQEYVPDNYSTNSEQYQQQAYVPTTSDGQHHQQSGAPSEQQYQNQEPQYQQQEQQLLYEQQQQQMYQQYYEQQELQQQQWQQQQEQLQQQQPPQQQYQQQGEQQQSPADLVSVDDLMAHAATVKKTHFNNKRFQKSNEEVQTLGNSYAEQKMESERRAGNREEGSARSLVR
jgi:hypothetical protein|eukprot:CAMPEP_0119038814 /NCGR_PEP_ID=MMETSP1177-20130426/7944_1 /TAXON_ID=2985 /ORGANISM="Ochromonas sp, Strain CCMP1899" /LENGTH=238 /DNA_ID=CAMNT_0007001867 /DNA_START=115 /DNA_END=831 /DNA_ORIENTATION=+